MCDRPITGDRRRSLDGSRSTLFIPRANKKFHKTQKIRVHCPCKASGPPGGPTCLHALNEIAIFALNIAIDCPGSSSRARWVFRLRGCCNLGSLIPDGFGCGLPPTRAILRPTTQNTNGKRRIPVKGKTGFWLVWEASLDLGYRTGTLPQVAIWAARPSSDSLCRIGGKKHSNMKFCPFRPP